MVKKIDMQTIRYINLFDKVCRVHPKYCFVYNMNIVFVVPAQQIARAIGEQGKNVRKVSEILNRKIKVVQIPNGKEDIKKFITAIVYPTQFKAMEITDNEIIITAGGRQNKAMLFGRNKTRLEELKEIVKQFFNKELKIV